MRKAVHKEAPILVRNRDVEHIVNAAANYGHYGHGQTEDQRLTMLVITDVHGDKKRLQNAVEYLNGMDALDAGICLGDMQGSCYTDNDGTWYVDTVKRAEKPFYTMIGNHDGGNSNKSAICGTKQQVFETFIAPLRECIGIPNLEKTYYAVNFDEYKITMIVLDNYDVTDDRDEAGDFLVSRGINYLGQEQIDWLIDTLSKIPKDYHVLIARHALQEKGIPTVCNWSMEGGKLDTYLSIGTPYVVQDIMDVWLKGISMNREYIPQAPGLPKIQVRADFTHREPGVFIGYLIGHEHWDWQGKIERYPEQNFYCFAATANDNWQNYCCDLPRKEGTKAEDCITVFSVDRKNRRVCLVRVGSNITNTMVDRTFIALEY